LGNNESVRTLFSKSITLSDGFETENKGRGKGSSGNGRKLAAVGVALFSTALLDRNSKAARGKEL
jgi:hypothetical protein